MDDRELVRFAIAAFSANPKADDQTIGDTLVKVGLSLSLANRLVAFLPLAFGRVALARLTDPPRFAQTFLMHGLTGEHPLDREPLFVQALQAARTECNREEMSAVGMRSSEVAAVNNALNAGAKLAGAVFAPPVLFGLSVDADEGRAASASRWSRLWKRPAVPNDGADPRALLAQLLSGHGLAPRTDDAVHVLKGGARFAARLFTHTVAADGVNLQLDVRVQAPALGGRTLIESAGGWAPTIHGAVGEALRKLSDGSFHVLLAALVAERFGGEQVEWERWSNDATTWRACLGPLQTQYSRPDDLRFGELLDRVKARLLDAGLAAEPHWLRLYYAGGREAKLGSEALLDNEPWAEGEELLDSWPWPVTESMFGVRHFMILLPA